MPDWIRVAIIGGGISGCTLANGLLRYANIDWHVFEQKQTLIERGAAIGFRDNASQALSMIGLNPSDMYKNTGAVISNGSRCIIATGEHRGRTILDVPAYHISVARDRWLQELIRPLPKSRLHTKTKLLTVVQFGGDSAYAPYFFRFEDGSTWVADAVIGCDGTHSMIRKFLYGSRYPGCAIPRFGGHWDTTGKTTPEEVVKRFGTKLFDPSRSGEVVLAGDGSFVRFCPGEDGIEYSVTVSTASGLDWGQTAPKKTVRRESLENAFESWDSDLRNAIIDLLMAEGSKARTMSSQWVSPETPVYSLGGLCLLGDAAHSMLPCMGFGAATGTEDAAMISAVLGFCGRPHDVVAAFQAFGITRRQINDERVIMSQWAAKMMSGEMGLDAKDISHMKPDRWWLDIIDTNVGNHICEAVEKLQRVQAL